MSTHVITSGIDTQVEQSAPTKNYGSSPDYTLRNFGGVAGSVLMYFPTPVAPGSTVSSAILTLFVLYEIPGPATAQVFSAASSWKQSTVTWNSKPAVGTTSSAVVTIPEMVGLLNIDITSIVASWAAGAPNYGLVIQSAGTAGSVSIQGFSSTAPPFLVVSASWAPDTPSTLRPAGYIGTTTPVLSWAYGDIEGSDLQALNVQFSTSSTFSTLLLDSGVVAASIPQIAVSSLSAVSGYGTLTSTLAAGSPVYWRARVQDQSGIWSSWSDPVLITYATRPTVTLTNPGAAGTVTEVTPTITWTSTSAQTAWEVTVEDTSTGTVLADSKRVSGTTQAWQVPAGAIEPGGTYLARVQVWDNVVRSSSPGDAAYMETTRTFAFAPSSTKASPTGVAAAETGLYAGAPMVDVTWNCAGAPDYFTVYRDGVVLAAQRQASALLQPSGDYLYVDHAVKPRQTHTYTIDAVYAGVASNQSAPSAPLTVYTTGIWLTDPARNLHLLISGTDVDNLDYSDQVTTEQLVGSQSVQQVIQGMYGLSGTITGYLYTRPEAGAPTMDQLEAIAWQIKAAPTSTYRLVIGDINIPVVVSQLSVAPSSLYSSGGPRRRIKFDIQQVGEYPFSVSF